MSLLELMVVVGIIAAVGVVALPQLADVQENYRLEALAREVSGNLSNARILAVTENVDHRIKVSDTTTYVREEQGTGTWTTEETYDLPTGFTIGTTGAIAEFESRGNASTTATFVITNPNGLTANVVVETSGRSHVQ